MTEELKKEKIRQLLTRGVENIIPSKQKLEELLLSGKKLNVYLGVDPTATHIHLGNAVPIRKLQIMAELGHSVKFLIGDFTALIGDTSDKDTERPVLTMEQIKENFKGYKKQAEKILDFSRVKVVHNSDWLKKLNFVDVVKLTRHFSLNDFISRELIKKRLTEGKSVSLPEVLYPVMQGYDSYFMDMDIQFGGTDQTFNMQAGRTLMKDLRNKESFVVANGFLEGTDGRKMSKSWGNAIWLDDTPEEMFGKAMSLKDDLIVRYFELATSASEEKIEEIKNRLKTENPMFAKRELAMTLVSELHDPRAAKRAEEYFTRTVVDKVPEEGDMVELEVEQVITVEDLIEKIVEKGVLSSKSEVRRLIDQGGIYVNDERLTKEIKELRVGDLVRVGKRKYVKLVG